MKRYSDSIKARLTGRHKKCIDFCGKVKDKRILNIGCYNGWFEKFMLKKGCDEIIGIDVNDKILQYAQKTVGGVKFIKASVFDIEFPNNYFDLVTMFDVIEHLPRGEEVKALKKTYQILKKRGELFISIPANNFLSNILDPVWYFGHRHYSQKQLNWLLEEAGFKIGEVEYGGRFYELFSIVLLYFLSGFYIERHLLRVGLIKKETKSI